MSALFRRALAGAVLAVAATAVHAQPAVPDGLTVAPTARTTDELLVSWTAVAGCYREHDSNEVAGAMPWEEDA